MTSGRISRMSRDGNFIVWPSFNHRYQLCCLMVGCLYLNFFSIEMIFKRKINDMMEAWLRFPKSLIRFRLSFNLPYRYYIFHLDAREAFLFFLNFEAFQRSWVRSCADNSRRANQTAIVVHGTCRCRLKRRLGRFIRRPTYRPQPQSYFFRLLKHPTARLNEEKDLK